jgi:hypothetical protein
MPALTMMETMITAATGLVPSLRNKDSLTGSAFA